MIRIFAIQNTISGAYIHDTNGSGCLYLKGFVEYKYAKAFIVKNNLNPYVYEIVSVKTNASHLFVID